MKKPEFRCPTKKSIESLVERFGFVYSPIMQDWAWEVADSSRIDEFLKEYESGKLSNDEKFTLMETIIQSIEDSNDVSMGNEVWLNVLTILQNNFQLHQWTIWYWALFEHDDKNDFWRVTSSLRKLYRLNN